MAEWISYRETKWVFADTALQYSASSHKDTEYVIFDASSLVHNIIFFYIFNKF